MLITPQPSSAPSGFSASLAALKRRNEGLAAAKVTMTQRMGIVIGILMAFNRGVNFPCLHVDGTVRPTAVSTSIFYKGGQGAAGEQGGCSQSVSIVLFYFASISDSLVLLIRTLANALVYFMLQ